MSDINFYEDQRQSKIGIILIFARAVVGILKNFWVLGVYFIVQDFDPRTLVFAVLGISVLLLVTLIYSILYYMKFTFHIDKEKREFILHKGVFSSDVVTIPFDRIQQVNYKRDVLQRIIGVYSIVIDTAGSSDEEVEIKALSEEKANILAGLLTELSTREKAQKTQSSQEEEPSKMMEASSEWEFKLDIPSLLKLGLTSNYLRGIALLVAFYFSLREQFRLTQDFVDVGNIFVLELASSVLLFVALFFIGVIITVGETFIKYYNLRVTKRASGLEVEMGLRENTKVGITARRVQLVQLLTNPIQKRLDLSQLKISLASSQNNVEKKQISIPGLPKRIVSAVKEYIFQSEITEKHQILPNKILLYRKLLPLAVTIIGIKISSFEVPSEWIIGGSIAYILLLALFQYYYYKSMRLFVSEGFLVKQSGIWLRRKQFFEMYKLQSVSLSQPLWYKKRNIVDIIFHTAGGDISFGTVNKKEILPLMNYLLYKVESTSKPWM